MSERERGPLESELHELIRRKGLGFPEILQHDVTGADLTVDESINIAWQMNMVLMEAVLRLAREIDDSRSGG
jgi:hypothetical protein